MSPRHGVRSLLLALLTLLAVACGGGAGGGTAPAAPTLTLSATSVAVGSSARLTWSSADATSCSASGSWSGALAPSGSQTITPSAAGTFTYTLACANPAGSSKTSSATLTATALSYGSPNYQFSVGVAANTLTPSNAGSISAWSISPALPPGLAFDATTGAIGGTPTATSPTAPYVITGSSAGGPKTQLDLAIGVTSNVILNLGDVASPQYMQFDTAHVLTQDVRGHWYLWNYATTAQIANGVSLTPQVSFDSGGPSAGPAAIALAGPTAVIQTVSGLEVRSSSTGQVLAEIAVDLPINFVDGLNAYTRHASSWWTLATDGSYVCAGNTTSLTCWSPNGQQLFTEGGNFADASVIGNYANPTVLATPAALLIALGAKGSSVIETVSTATWTSSVGPAFQGAFSSWSVDGSHFLTTIPVGTRIGTTVAAFNTPFVYSPASVLEDTETMPTLQGLTGQGNWFWTTQSACCSAATPNTVTVYAIGHNTGSCMPVPCTMPTPTGTYTLEPWLVPIGTFIAALGASDLTVLDLSGATPVETNYTMPVANPGAFAAISPSQYMVSSGNGVIVDASTPGSPRVFDYGALTSFAGSNTRAVFSTASGQILSYNLTTKAFETTALQLPSDLRQLALSADGSVLAELYGVAGNVDVYSMPAGTLINSFTNASVVVNIGLSGGGTVLSEFACGGGCVGQSIPVAGGAWSVYPDVLSVPQISPDGTLIAVTNWLPPWSDDFTAPPMSRIYKDGSLVATVPGWPMGWPTNSSLIVGTFTYDGVLPTGQLNNVTFSGDQIYGPTGASLGSSPIGPDFPLQFASGDLAYDNMSHVIISTPSGATLWASADPTYVLAAPNPLGGVAASFFTGSELVFASGNLLLTQSY